MVPGRKDLCKGRPLWSSRICCIYNTIHVDIYCGALSSGISFIRGVLWNTWISCKTSSVIYVWISTTALLAVRTTELLAYSSAMRDHSADSSGLRDFSAE
jgi:hypothetical protein